MKNKINKKITLRYLPKRLTLRDKKLQYGMLMKSRKLYKKGKYFTRKALVSYKSRPSNHVTNATRLYGVKNIGVTNELARATGCSKESLGEIVKKGEGAYYSSGSRPNQTAQSWGLARLASSITSGKAAAVDFSILEKGCKKNSKALRLAKLAKKTHGHGTRRVPKA
jgi:hypothetical protein